MVGKQTTSKRISPWVRDAWVYIYCLYIDTKESHNLNLVHPQSPVCANLSHLLQQEGAVQSLGISLCTKTYVVNVTITLCIQSVWSFFSISVLIRCKDHILKIHLNMYSAYLKTYRTGATTAASTILYPVSTFMFIYSINYPFSHTVTLSLQHI